MKRDTDKRLAELERTRGNAERVTMIDIVGASACNHVEHVGGVRWNIETGERDAIPPPPCPLESCQCLQ